MNIRVLIVEDESLIRWSLRQKLEERGYQVVEAETGRAARQALESGPFDLVLLDYKLPDTTGLELLREMRAAQGDGVTIMMTAHSSIEHAVDAIKLGAFDYVPKPFRMEDLLFTLDKGLETTKLRREVRELRQKLQAEYGTDSLVGRHPSVRRLMDMIQRVALSGASTVFLRGETGTGKDLVARVIHYRSPRAAKSFVNITCTALSETLLESELFGHERGAFTDAKTQKSGLLEVADGGTVFLDEIGDMAPGLQAKLLRFLEERRFRRVGGTREITVDVRVIAATNREIENSVRSGRFREDLFYRLNVVALDLPPLRERGEDVLLLARHFIDRFAREFKKPVTDLDERCGRTLLGYNWPGNVRELRNTIERAVLLCQGERIGPDDIVLGRPVRREPWENGAFTLPPDGFDLNRLAEIEVSLLRQALERAKNNQVQAARLLRISRDRLRYRLRRYRML